MVRVADRSTHKNMRITDYESHAGWLRPPSPAYVCTDAFFIAMPFCCEIFLPGNQRPGMALCH